MRANNAGFITGLFLTASAIAGCGASSNSAPIVYGTAPTASARIYNSPADVYLAPGRTAAEVQREEQYEPQPRRIEATPYSRPAALTPVTSAPLTRTVYSEQTPPRPTYVAETTPTASPAAPWSDAAPRLMTVRAGDTVYAISRRTGASPNAIISENRLAPPYSLRVGQTLRIPAAGEKVVNRISQSAPAPKATFATHTIKPGDTLYSISRATGVSVSKIAQVNRLRAPYTLSVGDTLRVPGATAAPRAAALAYDTAANVADLTQNVSYAAPARPAEKVSIFAWPVKGAVIGKYGAGELGRRNDGVNIAAPVGTPVRAAADGEVVYRGSELEGYGNLLLIKHNDGYVTAYAHNDVMLVRKGQRVRQGQVVAKVGQTGSAPEPQLHFEIRQNLKSIDPLAFLQ